MKKLFISLALLYIPLQSKQNTSALDAMHSLNDYIERCSIAMHKQSIQGDDQFPEVDVSFTQEEASLTIHLSGISVDPNNITHVLKKNTRTGELEGIQIKTKDTTDKNELYTSVNIDLTSTSVRISQQQTVKGNGFSQQSSSQKNLGLPCAIDRTQKPECEYSRSKSTLSFRLSKQESCPSEEDVEIKVVE